MKSIKTKMVVYFSILIICSSILMGAMGMVSSIKALSNESEKSLITLSEETARFINSQIEIQKKTLEMIAQTTEIQSMNSVVQKSMLENRQKIQTFLILA